MVPVFTAINKQLWEKKRQEEVLGTSVIWDYEKATMFAYIQQYAYTVFMGTHTCFDHCSSLISHYYPNGPSSTVSIVESQPTESVIDSVTTTSVESVHSTTRSGGSMSNSGSQTETSQGFPSSNTQPANSAIVSPTASSEGLSLKSRCFMYCYLSFLVIVTIYIL